MHTPIKYRRQPREQRIHAHNHKSITANNADGVTYTKVLTQSNDHRTTISWVETRHGHSEPKQVVIPKDVFDCIRHHA